MQELAVSIRIMVVNSPKSLTDRVAD